VWAQENTKVACGRNRNLTDLSENVKGADAAWMEMMLPLCFETPTPSTENENLCRKVSVGHKPPGHMECVLI